MTAVLEPAARQSSAGALAPALDALRAGRPVLVCDADDREWEGDVVLPAALADPAWVAWTVRHTSGLLCVPMEPARADALDLPLMVRDNADPFGTAYTVSVDAATGVGTGISARDRARTARVLADPASLARDLTRPGHVLPLRARPGGVLERPGHTEAAVDLCRLAGLPPVGLIAEVVTGPEARGRTAYRSEIAALGAEHDVPVLDVADVVGHRHRHGDGVRARVTRGARAALATDHGPIDTVGYHDGTTGAGHLALVAPATGPGRPTLAVHTECIAGGVLGGPVCRCRGELDASLAAVARTGGAVLYLRAPAGTAPVCGHVDGPAAAGVAAAVAADLGLHAVRLRPGPVLAEHLRAGGIDAVPVPGP